MCIKQDFALASITPFAFPHFQCPARSNFKFMFEVTDYSRQKKPRWLSNSKKKSNIKCLSL
jgi:hypothetical protein